MSASIRKTVLGGVCLMALAVAGMPRPAGAQTLGSVISFGDSLSDNGNLATVQSAFGLPASTPSPPYFGGRFSNGPVFTEYLAGPMQQAGAAAVFNAFGIATPIDPNANQNYAFGGSRTDSMNLIPPGIPAQIEAFRAMDGKFSPNDVVTLYGGANDIFQYAGPPTPAGITAASLAAAANVGQSAARIASLGAPTLVVLNLPDIGATPSFNTNLTTSVAGSIATTSFNAALSQQIFASAAANPQTNTYLIDVNRLSTAIAADPARFGYSNVTDACLSVPSCATAPQAAQNSYLFFDGVHPTTRGHQLFAALVLDYLGAGQAAAEAGSLSETAILDRLEGADGSFSRGRSLAASAVAGAAPATGFYADVGGASYDRNAAGSSDGYDYRSGTLRVGYDRFLTDNFLAGGSVSAMTGEVDDTRLRYDTRSFAADIYGTAILGATHISVVAGVAHYDFDDIARRTLVPTVTNFGGDTNGVAANIGAEAGYTFTFGALTATPTLGLTYLHFDVDGFSETGLGAQIAYGDYDRDALYGAVGVELGYDTTILGLASHLTGRIAYEDSLTDDGDRIVSTIVGSPNRPVSAGFADLAGRGFTVGAGGEFTVASGVAADIAYSVGFSDDVDFSQTGHIGLKFAF